MWSEKKSVFVAQLQRRLESPDWIVFCGKVLRNHRWCDRCGETRNLSVRHAHYRTLGVERFEDVHVFCSVCAQERDESRGRKGVIDGSAESLLNLNEQLKRLGEYCD